jgi:hypothetical protein
MNPTIYMHDTALVESAAAAVYTVVVLTDLAQSDVAQTAGLLYRRSPTCTAWMDGRILELNRTPTNGDLPHS